MAIDFNDLRDRATEQLQKLKDKASNVDFREIAEDTGSALTDAAKGVGGAVTGATKGIANQLHKQPYWLTVPTATAGGVMLSRALKGDKADMLSDIIGALGGAAGGAALGKAISSPKDFGEVPRRELSDILGRGGPIGPIAGAAKHIIWDMWGPLGKTLIPAVTALALTYKFNPAFIKGHLGDVLDAARRVIK